MADLLPTMGTRLDIASTRSVAQVRRAMGHRKRGWAGTIDTLAASFLDAQLTSIDAALEYLASLVVGPVRVDPLAFLGQIGTRALSDFLDSLPEQVDTLIAGGADKDEALASITSTVVERAALEPHIVGRDVVATVATNDPRFIGFARVADPEACDWCKMLAGRGAVYTDDTVLVTRSGQPYHTKQKRRRKDGSIYEPGGACQCTMAALPKGSGKVPSDVHRAPVGETADLYAKGAKTPERAASIARQVDTLRTMQAAGRGTEWSMKRMADLEREAMMLAISPPSPRAMALGVLVRGLAMRYDPDQPRDPAGSDTGGQWTKAGAKDPNSFDWSNALKTVDQEKIAAQVTEEAAAWQAWADDPANHPAPMAALKPLNIGVASALKAKVATDLAERMKDVPAEELLATARAVDDSDAMGLYVAMDDINGVQREMGREDWMGPVRLARDLDGQFYAYYPEVETPIAGWTYADPGTPEFDQWVREGSIAGLVDKWSQTSNDHDAGSLAIQQAIRQEFGITDAASWVSDAPDPTNILRDHGDTLRAYARATYDNTQADLAAQGITEVTVYRGTGAYKYGPLAEGQQVAVGMRPASSWSTDNDTATGFANSRWNEFGEQSAVLVTTVPASRVLSTPTSGIGCLSEAEVVLLGGSTEVTVDRVWMGNVTPWPEDVIATPVPA